MAIAIGCDEAAFELKQILKQVLIDRGLEVEDFGTHDTLPVLYPDIAFAAAQSIVDGRNDRAVLLCGTGIGMAISANKVPGIRAAQCHDTYSAERARKSNDAQVLTMGARVVGPELAKTILHAWLASEFEPARSGPKIARIREFEEAVKKA
ncbi:ribose 5-phosphate isomerase B [Rhodopila sp.]|uniref:ribose 5-phosphate isomerase B n=1 Tax=Rhodopila sp. TaxID=2480087 RepID=UPI003D118305